MPQRQLTIYRSPFLNRCHPVYYAVISHFFVGHLLWEQLLFCGSIPSERINSKVSSTFCSALIFQARMKVVLALLIFPLATSFGFHTLFRVLLSFSANVYEICQLVKSSCSLEWLLLPTLMRSMLMTTNYLTVVAYLLAARPLSLTT